MAATGIGRSFARRIVCCEEGIRSRVARFGHFGTAPRSARRSTTRSVGPASCHQTKQKRLRGRKRKESDEMDAIGPMCLDDNKQKHYIEIKCRLNSKNYRVVLVLAGNNLFSRDAMRYAFARSAMKCVLFISGTVCIPLFLLSPKNIKNTTFYAYYFGRHVSHFYGISWELRGQQHLMDSGAVIVANHQHELDIVGMFTFWPLLGKCTTVAKRELLWSPFGVAAWLAGIVFIDRSNSRSARERINRTSKVLHDNTKIFIFPEGTRNRRVRETKSLLPFKKGAFHIAIKAQVPVLPFVFSPYYFLDDDDKILRPGGKVIVSILPPIGTAGMTGSDAGMLANLVRDTMQVEYARLAVEVGKYAQCS